MSTKTAKPKRVVARRMIRATKFTLFDDGYYSVGHSELAEDRKKFLAFPSDRATYDALVEQVAQDLSGNLCKHWSELNPEITDGYRVQARAVLRSLGLLPL